MHDADMESEDDRRSAVPSWHDEDEEAHEAHEGRKSASRLLDAVCCTLFFDGINVKRQSEDDPCH